MYLKRWQNPPAGEVAAAEVVHVRDVPVLAPAQEEEGNLYHMPAGIVGSGFNRDFVVAGSKTYQPKETESCGARILHLSSITKRCPDIRR